MKIMTVIGTRPEAIKMAPVILALRAQPSIQHVLCVTAQHREMLDQVLGSFGLTADIDLDLMRPTQQLHDLTARIVREVGNVIGREKPDWVLVQGDTTTVLGASLASFYGGVAVGHIEAGLRTDSIRRPFPEEMNRRVTGMLSHRHFAATKAAKENLLREGVPENHIVVTGNTGIDALHVALKKRSKSSESTTPDDRRCILVTCHRRENFGAPMERIFKALRHLAERGDVRLVIPIHPNPNVENAARAILSGHEAISLIKPLEYTNLVALMSDAYFVITDSGGIQEEAPGIGKPVLVTREETERPEGIAAGVALLVGSDMTHIIREAERLLDDDVHYASMAGSRNPYGDGQATQRIVASLLGESFSEFVS
jgi:UDP-N-acetylglucosamine 2-epimerase (non-hydrolysing)